MDMVSVLDFVLDIFGFPVDLRRPLVFYIDYVNLLVGYLVVSACRVS